MYACFQIEVTRESEMLMAVAVGFISLICNAAYVYGRFQHLEVFDM